MGIGARVDTIEPFINVQVVRNSASLKVLKMTKDKIKRFFDLVPLFILIVYAIILVWTVWTTDIVLSNEHYIGLALLFINGVFFLKRHKPGVLLLGFTLLLGLLKVLSYSAVMTFYSLAVQ